MKLDDVRREYLQKGLKRSELDEDPVQQLEKWLGEAANLELTDNTAMTLATVDADGQPSQRVVLLKQLDQDGLVFYTNLNSKKAQDIKANSKVSANFAWLPLERQVKIQGVASRISNAEAFKYFVSRPRNSQLAAWASNQSQPISSRQVLKNAFEQMKSKFSDGEVPLPDFWGGYRIKPTLFEFWQGGGARLHDRFQYTPSAFGWDINRLAP
ncbi:pyridoxamine 5'-phosphate oxidase [Aliikangiella sp. G2MR2-5]|uniref:pyridoxamine 5'-phosphate oxidase n=1 Tax=Aliikangiella sp. G2MR2-5 TaxID=2788943 RepID=UPI0018A96EBB|nr:pyridoxamine 5'-phosphate oxidase [Aliikangiella sp. G2MR2-5]